MFLLVSVRNVAAHPGGHQHGVSTSIYLDTDILLTWILARIFVYLPSFISQIPDLVYWTVLIFILIYFEWRDTENQHYLLGVEINLGHTHKTRLAGTLWRYSRNFPTGNPVTFIAE